VHQKHVGLGSTVTDGVACGECHAVPADLSHVGNGAAVAFGALATQGGLAATYAGGSCASTYCHGARLAGAAQPAPTWSGTVACGDCHGTPPTSGLHATTVVHSSQPCWTCHATVASDTAQAGILDTAAARALHVNGAKDVSFAQLVPNVDPGTWDPAAKSCSNVACHSRLPTTRYW
jgi:predicted CxxxxCH...CXXCH cytochrome family protein